MRFNSGRLFICTIITFIFSLPLITFAGDSTLDSTFGTDGMALTTVGSVENIPSDIAIQTDGKIIQIGSSRSGSTSYGYYINLIRFNTDGSLDTTFDSDGKVSTTIGTYTADHASSIAIQEDGKIVIGGKTSTDANEWTYWDVALLRYNTDGSLDLNFGSDGIVVLNPTSSAERITDIAFQSDGKIIAVGNSMVGLSNRFLILRFNTDGSLDSTFGSNGIIVEHFNENSYEDAYSVAVLSDDSIIVAGRGVTSTGKHTVSLLKLTSAGALDTSFHTDGRLATTIGDTSDAYSVIVDINGKFVVGGYTELTSDSDTESLLLRYNSNGTLDTTFGTNGIVITSFGADSQKTGSLVIQSDEKIIALSILRTSSYFYYIGLGRYNTDGSLDTTFDNDDGLVTTLLDTSTIPDSIVLQTDGKILVGGGKNISGYNYYYSVLRYGEDVLSFLPSIMFILF